MKWAPMRKIRYSQPLQVSGQPSTTEFLPEPTAGLWIPFYFFWDQTNEQAPTTGASVRPVDLTSVQTREDLYFTDS